jgi:hypothetical protein
VRGAFDDLGRFAEPWLLVLTSLADGPKPGYAIMTDIAAFSGVRMEPGTLYWALSGWSVAVGSGRWIPPGTAARTRSLRRAQAGRVRRCDRSRAVRGRPCVTAAVDKLSRYSVQLSKRY